MALRLPPCYTDTVSWASSSAPLGTSSSSCNGACPCCGLRSGEIARCVAMGATWNIAQILALRESVGAAATGRWLGVGSLESRESFQVSPSLLAGVVASWLLPLLLVCAGPAESVRRTEKSTPLKRFVGLGARGLKLRIAKA
eukprot:CAMPEP_0196742696 /NCGR_PEP_ID=MMETSP1091-20130531/48292_1 /TAXON_ID=302021 /ORGANISM="Rhodomonas sp., Strain CCMP768" /LENGTH=141 /DNA_ID=CAMNT_0042088829 /DNA_START=132 /DNA_END=557 /DNA_ORIENTATION=-